MSNWLPIETAPKDGTLIMIYRPGALNWGKVDTASWDDNKYAKKPKGYWRSLIGIMGVTQMRDWLPTHWQPRLAPPA